MTDRCPLSNVSTTVTQRVTLAHVGEQRIKALDQNQGWLGRTQTLMLTRLCTEKLRIRHESVYSQPVNQMFIRETLRK